MAATQTKGVIATAVAATGLANKQDQGLIDARMKVSIDTYTTSGNEGVGSTITMGPILPQGARIINIDLIYTAMSGATISVGDTNSASRYQNGTAVTSAGKTGITAAAGINYEIGTNTGDNQIVLTIAGATLAASATIKVLIEYSFD